MSPEYTPEHATKQLSFAWSPSDEAVRKSRRFRSKLLFLAKPPDHIAREIFEATQRHADSRTHRRAYPAKLLHISLVCVGEFDTPPLRLIKRLQDETAKLEAGPISIAMDASAIFGSERSLVLRSLTETGELGCLAERLKGILRRENLPYAELGPVKPHVTVIYGCGKIELMPVIKPYRWTIDTVELVFSHCGAQQHEGFGLWRLLRHTKPYQHQYQLGLSTTNGQGRKTATHGEADASPAY